ncbi:MAG: FAD-dependent monooxygenase [Fibrobacterota bacterium]
MHDTEFDILISGGGPAGCACAIAAARKGLRSAVIEKTESVSEKICGGGLSGRAVSRLKELGIYDNFLRDVPHNKIDSVFFSSPSGHSLKLSVQKDPVFSEKSGGFTVYRRDFDSFLQKQAEKAGAVFFRGLSECGKVIEDKKIVFVNCEGEGAQAPLQFRARFFFGASGYRGPSYPVLRKNSRLKEIRGIRAFYSGVYSSPDTIEMSFEKQIIPGYFWVFTMPDGLINAGFTSYPIKGKNSPGMRKMLLQLESSPVFSERFSNARIVGEPEGWILPSGGRPVKTALNFAAGGDEAAMVDAFTGEGIGNAMYSGVLAADSAAEKLAGNKKTFFRIYDRKFKRVFKKEIFISFLLLRLAKKKALFDFVLKNATRNDKFYESLIKIVSGSLSRFRLLNPFFYFPLIFSALKQILKPKYFKSFGIAGIAVKDNEEAKSWQYTPWIRTQFHTPVLESGAGKVKNPFASRMLDSKVVLDFGCGSGRNAPWVFENTGAFYLGIDPNPYMTGHFWDNNDKKYSRRAYITNSFDERVRYYEGKVDLVLTTFVFQHIGFRPSGDVMNISDLTSRIKKLMKKDSIWVLYEHENEEKWVERWLLENDLKLLLQVRDVYVPDHSSSDRRGRHDFLIVKA